MIKLNINLGERSYPIYITSEYGSLEKSFKSARISGKVGLVTDTNVDKCQSEECINALKDAGLNVHKFVIEAGEKSKNLGTINDIYKFLVENKFDRNSSLVALGGGVVGDITGFAAATFLRGINFIQIPTSLLAQADSSVGGKVGVDFEGNKNLIGAFYQPRFVYMNVNSLKTLPIRELRAGLAEIIKHGIIRDADFYEYIDYNIKKIFNFDEYTLQYMAKINCSIKGAVVEQDEKESDLRAILNFGHTIGHAIESAYGFEYLHGECVSLGMVAAFKMAHYLEMVNQDSVNTIKNTLTEIGLPVKLERIDVEKIYEHLLYDKKIRSDKILFILPKGIGEVVQCVIDDVELIKRVIGDMAE